MESDNVVRAELKTDTLRVTVLPELGGKIASLIAVRAGTDVELLQQPLAAYGPRDLTMGFEESDASGFDECLPSVAACMVKTAAGEVGVPDHGDFWRLPCVWQQEDGKLTLAASGASLPLFFERELTVEGSTLTIGYRLRNDGSEPVPYGWSAHPLFSVDAGDRIVIPGREIAFQVEGSAGNRLGARGARHSWPLAKLNGGAEADLSIAGAIGDGIGDKIYLEAPKEGWAAIERKQSGLRLTVKFDPAESPWLGMWICYGGWPESGTVRQQCVAIEPCTAPMDSLAEAAGQGWARTLQPGAESRWTMQITVGDVIG